MTPGLLNNLNSAADALENALLAQLAAVQRGDLINASQLAPALQVYLNVAAWYLKLPKWEEAEECRDWFEERFKDLPCSQPQSI